ncbi:MAG: hypothetical protein HC831_20155 [Chloroflexia bacterium]|nr:hypothetical protein [Chloroflexia bacterium]
MYKLFITILFLFTQWNPGADNPFFEPTEYPFYSGTVFTKPAKNKGDLTDSTQVVLDSLRHPLFYSRQISTGVCETNQCKPVHLTLFWDMAGSFLGFQIPKEEPLTKANHAKFTLADYYRLYTILNDPDSKIGNLSKQKLVQNNTRTAIDAISAATQTTNKNIVVSGAAFTCYTLWHIVNNNSILPLQPLNQNKKKLSYWKSYFENMQKIPAGELAINLQQAHYQNILSKFIIQKLITKDMKMLSPLKCLIINNYLNRQKYIYPEARNELNNCKNLNAIFLRMTNHDVNN